MPDLALPPDPHQQTRPLRLFPANPFSDGLSDATGTHAEAKAPVEGLSSFSGKSMPTPCKADIALDDLTGLSLGQYALGRKVGGGGMGKVFTARHVHLDRSFAIKFLGSDISHSTEAHLRFEQEVLALGKLQHPNIVNAVDAGCVHGLKYLVTELIDGEDFTQLVQRRGMIPIDEACELIFQAALGLAYSHQCGFVHRDIKPSNLIVNRVGVVKILDFGLVRTLKVDHQLTDNGELLGTWDFIAPEQAHDASNVDRRCDIYGLGCTLLYLLSGQVPFSSARYATPAAKLKGHLFDTPPWLESATTNLPPMLRDVLERMLAKEPDQRYSTSDEVAEELAAFLKRASDRPRKKPAAQPAERVVTLEPRKSEESSNSTDSTDHYHRPRWPQAVLLLSLVVVLGFAFFGLPRTPGGINSGSPILDFGFSSGLPEIRPENLINRDALMTAPVTEVEPSSLGRSSQPMRSPNESSKPVVPDLDLHHSQEKARTVPAVHGL